MNEAIALDDIATDAVALVQAFRANGEVSFQDVPLTEARANYVKACAVNGLPPEEVAGVDTRDYPVAGGHARLRRYRPLGVPAQAVTPVLLFIHGGGWVVGDLDSHDGICRTLANQTAATVIAVDYRRAPEHPFPVPLDDCQAALQFIGTEATALLVDPDRLLVVGDSAGANMATLLANLDGSTVKGQVLFYPVTDLGARHPSYQRITRGFPLTARTMHWFRDQYTPGRQDWDDPRLSPLLHAKGRRQPPLFILTAGLDPLADEGIAYASAAAQAGTAVLHRHLPRHAHGVLTSAGKVDTGRQVLAEAARFIVEVLISAGLKPSSDTVPFAPVCAHPSFLNSGAQPPARDGKYP
ncbi:alpha/beta hydrolase [Pseudomonas sp. dw_358]|uniref:alpha/beta hydrolase n=1 Tax=Pseudomonas sp. dw_358 TaxID=2720083 RepID=UPI001BD3FCA4|nr:alpha/beta hydrolase [Pseudomonas sp. dw_358]